MRKPNVVNKYNIKFADIKKLMILDRDRIKIPLFWRNEVIKAWCVSESVGNSAMCDDTGYWLAVYDSNKIDCQCHAFGGMCSYKFKSFFKPEEIETEDDLRIQELLLEKVNFLIDEKILGLQK